MKPPYPNRYTPDDDPQHHQGKILENKYSGVKRITPEIVRALQYGDPDAYKAVYLCFYEPLTRFISSIIRNDSEAEEIAQETMTLVWENHANLDPAQNISGYIYTMGRNAAMQYLRKRKVQEGYANDYQKWGDGEVSGEGVIIAREIELLIKIKMSQLTEQKRRIFEMHREKGMTYDEIALEFGISANTVKYHISGILKELRETLMLFVLLLILS